MNGIKIKNKIVDLLLYLKLPIPASICAWEFDQLNAYYKLCVEMKHLRKYGVKKKRNYDY